MKAYRRVTAEDRSQLITYLNAGLNQSEISVKFGFGRATISRELSRNMVLRGY